MSSIIFVDILWLFLYTDVRIRKEFEHIETEITTHDNIYFLHLGICPIYKYHLPVV